MLDDFEKGVERISKIRRWLYNREKRAEKEEKILIEHDEVMKTLKKLNSIPERLEALEHKMDDLTIGLQKELLTSLRTLRDEYCDKRKWCSDLEKEEYAAIYEVYHEKLGGNHTATRYLTEVLTLPTEPPEG
jgi:hypothetical protein